MNSSLQAARAALVAAVRMYAPVHTAMTNDATRALETAMDNLQAAAVAAAQVPAAAPPVPAGAQPLAAAAAPRGNDGDGHDDTDESSVLQNKTAGKRKVAPGPDEPQSAR